MSNNGYLPEKEKADELVEKFTFHCRECNWVENAIQSAIVCANELMESNHPFETDYWSKVIDCLNNKLTNHE